MSSCVLRVSLPEGVDLDEVLQSLPVEPLAVFRRGAPPRRPGGRVNEIDSFNVLVSDHDGDRLAEQVTDAEAFLTRHRAVLQRLSSDIRANMSVDFGTYFLDGAMSLTHRLPAALLRLCGELGIGVDVSIYRTSDSNE